ncbi:hypothetical protein B484DRAFT_415865 [Ochromonadaceae sp. CCMP2298]|nr:hypothetical protein B484DRAFT_415865 [Ochromonadaceae sp. CCMP2298]|mmetsp:Transcript_3872/g.8734  ORF Transcript_3872/g.8734 Transcript_3872/m.8734 type:complete len:531 (+) Transcript_3872:142-1734(+)|eukprot:CAMPEP_0173203638 /NCGR_PEP_ID=MMETSP1141-20130122/19638_1 /TAXON_ID=483371 /ORGANISM="non described non described, Strain CCMP2298" /LENGTH=530 /DNA_ID=CAMNT_0014129133 /DNA_START=59 /DNA_END=1651 /DNA_ORIENTATION=-
MVSIELFITAVLVIIACINASEVLSTAPVAALESLSKYQDKDSVKLVALFGFGSSAGAALYEKLFEDPLEDGVIVNIDEPAELLQLGGSNVAVGFLGRKELVVDETNFLRRVQSFVDGAARAGAASQLVIIIEGERDANAVELEAMAGAAVEGSRVSVRTVYMPVDRSSSAYEVEVSQVRSLLDAPTRLSSVKDLRQRLQGLGAVGTSAPATEVSELEAAAACRGLSESFAIELESSLQRLLGRGLLPAGSTLNSTVQGLRATLEEAVGRHHAAYKEQFLKHKDSQAMRAAAYRARLELSLRLLPVYRTITESMLQGSIDAYEKRLVKIPPVPRVHQLLAMLAEGTVGGFEENLELIRSEFLEMVGLRPAEGLLSNEHSPASCAWIPANAHRAGIAASLSTHARKNERWWAPQYAFELEKRRLHHHVTTRGAERVNALFLAGTYNPYIRDSPFPPTHINLNYLVDPSAVAANRAYKQLYDEHKEGPCDGRAEPLVIPGVAAIPFDPNQHPSGTEKSESLLSMVKDYFRGD